jgi:hypothetical protein
MIVEMHCHTSEHSACSHVAAVDLVQCAHEMGINAVVLTDHHYQWKPEELEGLRHRACLPEICHLLAGQDVQRTSGTDVERRIPGIGAGSPE